VREEEQNERMLLTHRFTDSQLNLTLELFLQTVADLFGQRLISVILYGSTVFDDLAPGYGDLDFLAVVEDDLSDRACRQLTEFRKPLQSGDYGVFAAMIEGAFLPRQMLDPARPGHAFWWGTSGERTWQSNQLGWLVLHVIREHGIVIWGEDVRTEIPRVRREQLVQEVWETCRNIERHGKGGSLHSVDWLLAAARGLLVLREGRLSSKSEAADWAYQYAKGDWRRWLPNAKQFRLNPTLADSVESQRWLDGLMVPIMEASAELKQELERQGYQEIIASGQKVAQAAPTAPLPHCAAATESANGSGTEG
jgi:hypothetical protein